jgi:branched-chain amino acid transport system permease protein
VTTTTLVTRPAAPQQARSTREIVLMVTGAALLVGLVVWIIWNLVGSVTQTVQAGVYGLSNGVLYALIALGYTLVYGIIELINFAHGDLFMLGTLFSAFVMAGFGFTHANVSGIFGLILVLMLAMVFCASINVAIEFFAYRRLRHAPKLAPLITAVGMSFILQNIGLQWNGSQQRQWSPAMPGGHLSLGGVTIGYDVIIDTIITAVLLLIMTWVVTQTRAGKAMRATAQDQDAARLMGINVNRIISFTFAIGGALAGAAGLLYQQTIGTTSYSIGFQLGLIAFTSAVLGGIGNLTGAVLGGLLIGLIQGLNDGGPHGFGQQWSQTTVFVILILVMVFKPTGLLGKNVGEKV